jgi:hypothetical protein
VRHPNEIQLALFVGGELGLWDRWRVRRHVSGCSSCSNEVDALRAVSSDVRDIAGELPPNLNWNQLAEEMRGNIRVGLDAGAAIARFDKPAIGARPRHLGWNAAMVVACATVVFVAAFWVNLPQPQADHLFSALRRIRTDRIGTPVRGLDAVTEGVVLAASGSTAEVTENGRTMSLMHPHSDAVTVSVSMRGSVGVRYVDADTGQVTTNKVYDAEQ